MADPPANPTPELRTDRELVRAYLRSRGEAEFRALYRRHTPALYRMACRLAGPSRAEDLLQETWSRAARSLNGFEWRSALRTWLTGILVRCSRQAWRSEGDVRPLRAEDTHDEPEIEVPAERLLDLERALEALAPGYREVLVLHDIEGFTHEEIARSLNVLPGTSKSQLARARKALRGRLEGETRARENDEAAR